MATPFWSTSTGSALLGTLFAVPFLTMNAIVGTRAEPFFSLIRPGAQTSAREYVLLFVVLGLIPVGAFIAARPMFRRAPDGRRRYFVLNATLAAILTAGFLAISIGLGADIYRCDVLGIPNCD